MGAVGGRGGRGVCLGKSAEGGSGAGCGEGARVWRTTCGGSEAPVWGAGFCLVETSGPPEPGEGDREGDRVRGGRGWRGMHRTCNGLREGGKVEMCVGPSVARKG